MSFKVKVTKGSFVALSKKIKDVRSNPIDEPTAKKAGKAALKEMKALIRRGVSPITGDDFEDYHGSYLRAIRAGRFKGKRETPVNLRLTGEFLKSLEVRTERARSGFGFEIGFDNSDSEKKEEGHRRGTNNQKKRPIIPTDREGFTEDIEDAYVDIFRERIQKLINKALK